MRARKANACPAGSRETTAALVLLACVASSQCDVGRLLRNGRELNLLLITIDALRKDAVQPYAPDRPTAGIAEIGQLGTVFQWAYSLSNHTVPSIIGLFTSQPPSRFRFGRYYRIPLEYPSLAGLLGRRGYRTKALLGNWLLTDEEFGGLAGFESYLAVHHKSQDVLTDGTKIPGHGYHARPPNTTRILADAARNFIKRNRYNRFFLWVHFMDPHDPYAPPEEYLEHEVNPRLGTVIDFDRIFPEATGKFPDDFEAAENPLSEEEKEYVRQLYMDEAAYVDDMVAEILEELRTRELLSSTIVVLTADHGEEFWDHGELAHGNNYFDTSINVPLIIYHPYLPAAGVIDAPVSHLDVMPTLFGWFGFSPEPRHLGRSLAPLIRGEAFAESLIFSEEGGNRREGVSIVAGDVKVVFDSNCDNGAVVEFDSYGTRPRPRNEELRELEEACRHFRTDNLLKAYFEGERDPEYEQRRLDALRSLGYIE